MSVEKKRLDGAFSKNGGMGLEGDKVPFQLIVSVFRVTLSEYNQ